MQGRDTEHLDYDGDNEGYELWNARQTEKFIKETIDESGIDALAGFPREKIAAYVPGGEQLDADTVRWIYDKLFLIQDRLLQVYVAKRIAGESEGE